MLLAAGSRCPVLFVEDIKEQQRTRFSCTVPMFESYITSNIPHHLLYWLQYSLLDVVRQKLHVHGTDSSQSRSRIAPSYNHPCAVINGRPDRGEGIYHSFLALKTRGGHGNLDVHHQLLSYVSSRH